MQDRGEWIVPCVHDQPYLAKPPLFAWTIIAIAELRGSRAGELDARLASGLLGFVGVLATMIAARSLASERDTRAARALQPSPPMADPALWAALALLSGPLFVRSARTAELDILLVPLSVLGVAGVALAYRSHAERGHASFLWVLAAALASVACALTKGPPALLSLACAYLGVLAHASAHAGPGARARALWRAGARTHPLGVLGAGLAAWWGWHTLAASRVGAEAARASLAAEVDDNLHLFEPQAIGRYLEALAYGGGAASVGLGVFVAWAIRRRPPLPPGVWIVAAWAIGTPIVLAITTKGVPRYLTPIWPAASILTAVPLARWSAARPTPARALAGSLAGVALVLGAWYALGRERWYAERSPRAFLREVLDASPPGEPLACLEFWTGALDLYADRRVIPVGDTSLEPARMGTPAIELADLARRLELESSSAIVLAREAQPERLSTPPAREQFARAGLAFERLDTGAEFRIDSGRARVLAYRVTFARTTSPDPGS